MNYEVNIPYFDHFLYISMFIGVTASRKTQLYFHKLFLPSLFIFTSTKKVFHDKEISITCLFDSRLSG